MSQSEMNHQILHEFSRATFLVDLTAEGAPLRADLNEVQEVLNYLRSHNITLQTILGNDDSTEDAPRLPLKGFATELKSYGPLAQFLNIIVRAAGKCLTPRYLRDLRFLPHAAEMKDVYDSQNPLRPDILGLVCPPPDQQKTSWNDVAVIVEVKKKELELVQQLSTYARYYLAADRRRSFSITVAFDHKKLQMRFLIFHRSGISSSHELSLRSEAGFQGVVKHMVGILSIADEKAFGLDMTRIRDVFRINDQHYKIVRRIHERNSVRGRATAVYSVRACTAQDAPVIPQSRYLTLFGGVTGLPERMVYKLSYQTEGHTLEGDLLFGSSGQFGIVDVVGSHICALEEPFTSTAHHIKNCTFWDLSKGSAEGSPVNRYLHCTALTLEGLPLLDTSDTEAGIPGPAELLESILHAMIGHYNLFLGGVLHRDVSNGNILRLREPVERIHSRSMNILRPKLGENVNLSSCRAFLADLDHSIEWRKVPLAPSMDRSGTLPFMPRRLVTATYWNKPVLHTAADDLESFLLVLVWSLIHIFKHTLTGGSAHIDHLAQAFSSHRYFDIIAKESLITEIWPDEAFKGLIREWLMTAQASRTYLEELEHKLSTLESIDSQWDSLEEYCGEVYVKYIKAGYRHLEDIRSYRDWKAVVDAGGEKMYQVAPEW